MAVSPDPSETMTLEKTLTLEKGHVVQPLTLNMDPSMKMMIVHRNTGSPCLINVLLSYPSSAPAISHIKARVMDVQAAWPFLSYTVIDQRTTNPKFLCRTSPWTPDRLVFEATYTASGDPSVDLSKVYDHALRSCLLKTDLEEGPLWSVRVYTAETGRTYICVVADHCFIDGRGSIRLAKSIAGSDNLNFSHETQEFYAAVPPMAEGRAPTLFLLREACSMFILPRFPAFVSKRLGYVASWPTRFRRKPIDTRWRSSILSIDSAQILALKARAREHGVGTLNPILYAIYCVAHWCTFRSPHAYKTATVKDLRRKEDPYCVGNRLTLIRYTHHCHGSMSVWDLAQEYAKQVLSPEKAAEGLNLFRALNMLKDRPVDPRRSLPAPSLDELPVGDKRAHTKLEALALQGIHARKPKPGLSGIWSNAGYWALPPNADDLVFGVNGSHSVALFNVLLTGHENGVRMQIAYSDGACMDKSEIDQLEARIATVISRLVVGRGSDTFAGLCEP